MNWDQFEPFTLTHLLALFVCVALPLGIAAFSKKIRSNRTMNGSLRWFVSAGNVAIWAVACGFWFHPQFFRLEQSLPLHFCNLANLIAAAAVFFRWRWAQSLLYFWTFALCIWAFLTPFLMVGPSHPWFWAFWLYHLFIPLGTAWVLAVDQFRPRWKDCLVSFLVTLGYTAILAFLNAITKWNYGFVGPGKPGQPSIVDLLGSYPLRLLWMVLIGAALFILLLLPWRKPKSVKEAS